MVGITCNKINHTELESSKWQAIPVNSKSKANRLTCTLEFAVHHWQLPPNYIHSSASHFYQNQITSLKYIFRPVHFDLTYSLFSILDDPLNLNSTRKERKRPLHLLMHSQLSKFEFQLLHSIQSIMFFLLCILANKVKMLQKLE